MANEPRQPDSYIVRIYRREPNAIVGVVESPEREIRIPFRSFAELAAVLAQGNATGESKREHEGKTNEQTVAE